MNSFAPEIIDMIVSELQTDEASLHYASLVNRTWARASQPHIFRRIHLTTNSSVNRDPALFFARSSHLCVYVKEIDIRVACASKSQSSAAPIAPSTPCIRGGLSAVTAGLLLRLPSVERLELWADECPQKSPIKFAPQLLKPILQAIGRPSIRYLMFEGFEFHTASDLTGIMESIGSGHSLVSLRFQHLSIPNTTAKAADVLKKDALLSLSNFHMEASTLFGVSSCFASVKFRVAIKTLSL